jgi:hypothetical protein
LPRAQHWEEFGVRERPPEPDRRISLRKALVGTVPNALHSDCDGIVFRSCGAPAAGAGVRTNTLVSQLSTRRMKVDTRMCGTLRSAWDGPRDSGALESTVHSVYGPNTGKVGAIATSAPRLPADTGTPGDPLRPDRGMYIDTRAWYQALGTGRHSGCNSGHREPDRLGPAGP